MRVKLGFPVEAAQFCVTMSRRPIRIESAFRHTATETHPVPAVIPIHYPVTFLNCNTHSGPSSGIAT